MEELVALWNLNELSGQIMDSSGNNRNSTIVVGAIHGFAGRFDRALHFNGNGNVDFPAVFPHSPPAAEVDELTVEVWFKTTTPPPPGQSGVLFTQGWGGGRS